MRRGSKVLFYGCFLLTSLMGCYTYGQDKTVDSLKTLLGKASNDTVKLQLLYKLVENITDDGVWPKYNDAMYRLSEKYINSKDSITQRKAKKYYSGAINNMGYLNRMQGNIQKALEYYLRALKIQEELGVKDDIALSINNIGAVYTQQGQYDRALEYYQRALATGKELNDKSIMALALGNISTTYRRQGSTDKSLIYDLQSLKLWEELGNKHYICAVQNNIGVIFMKKEQYKEADIYFFNSLSLSRQTNNKHQETISLFNIGDALNRQGKYKEAFSYTQQSLELAKKTGNAEDTRDAAFLLSEIQQKKGDFKNALSSYLLHVSMRDSIFNRETRKKSLETQFQYEFDKKEATLKAEQEKKDAIAKEEASKQRIVRNSLLVILLLVTLFAFNYYRNYRSKQRANEIITAQKHLVEEKNKEILDSINYAKRIQTAILPGAELIKSHFSDYFIYYKPKDIVSGDFYSLIKKDDHIIIAAADCTGHGVPGALMSMIGSNMLNQAIIERGITKPSLILAELNQGVSATLKQNDAETNDGMDIALCSFNIETNTIEYSGANRPLWIISPPPTPPDGVRAFSDLEISTNISSEHTTLPKGEAGRGLITISPTKTSIGGHTNSDHAFENHEILLEKGDTFYLFSDGFVDQFGGPEGKKLMTKRFKEMLIGIQRHTMSEQEAAINKVFETWKGSHEQVDDVLVIGVRV